jgi:hypothetical protein
VAKAAKILDFDQPVAIMLMGSREQACARLLEALGTRRVDRAGSLMVVGSSGAGKSSLLQAGLVPALRRGQLTGGGPTAHALATPTDQPMRVLAELERAAYSVGAVCVIDQLEELFALCPDPGERRAFLDVLCARSGPGGTGLVVVCVRADFYGHLLDHEGLAGSIGAGQLALGPMTAAEASRAIAEPAREARLDLEPGLLEVLLRDLGLGPSGDRAEQGYCDPGTLPLLAHTLRCLWQQKQGRTLTLAGYHASGGLHGSGAATAERAWARLDDGQRLIARPMLLRLVHLADGVEPTRRRMRREQLLRVSAADPARVQAAGELLGYFAGPEVRLVVVDTDIVTFAHEAVLAAWPRLRGWIKEDRRGLVLRQRLADAADAWLDGGRDSSLLLRGARLALVQAWAEQDGERFGVTDQQRTYLSACVRAQRRHTSALRAVVALQTGLLVVVILALWGLARAGRVLAAHDQATLAHEWAAASYGTRVEFPEAADLLAARAFRASPDAQDRSAVLSSEAVQRTPGRARRAGLRRRLRPGRTGRHRGPGRHGAVVERRVAPPGRPGPRGGRERPGRRGQPGRAADRRGRRRRPGGCLRHGDRGQNRLADRPGGFDAGSGVQPGRRATGYARRFRPNRAAVGRT